MTSPPPPLRLGLTGGIGSGKSTVSQMLHGRGAAVIDADAIARQLTAAQGAAMHDIETLFGKEFIDSSGALNREKMRSYIFDHPEAKRTLESIIHPLVFQETRKQAQWARDKGHQTVVFDVPLLVESGRWRSQLDRILVIDCTEITQINRVIARNQLPRQTIEKIIASQASRSQRLRAADWIICNDQISLEKLNELVSALPI